MAGYGYKLEGSTDGTTWQLMSDQTDNKFPGGNHQVHFPTSTVRYVRLTTTKLPSGRWASISEMRLKE